MARKQVGQLDADLLARVDELAGELGQTRVVFISRALERALSEAEGISRTSRPTGIPVPSASAEGVRSAAPARKSAGIVKGERRLLVGPVRRAPVDPFQKGE